VILATGQNICYDQEGRPIPCRGTGQDGEFRLGLPWPEPRFSVHDHWATDELTGLCWSLDANPAGFPMTWQEGLEWVAEWNRERYGGASDWRMPNRRELRSLMDYQARKPALAAGHPFRNVFLGWYWSSTSAAINPAYAWYVHMEGARMFYGRKDQYYLIWPVRGTPRNVLATGQETCYDQDGNPVPCQGTGQDGEYRYGIPAPAPRFAVEGEVVRDLLTGLVWLRSADLTGKPVDWAGALGAVAEANRQGLAGIDTWRLPNINELESLVDARCHSPALGTGHPFLAVREAYWSSTTSFFETDWAWVLYLHKGATGVGYKRLFEFHVWPVTASALAEPRKKN